MYFDLINFAKASETVFEQIIFVQKPFRLPFMLRLHFIHCFSLLAFKSRYRPIIWAIGWVLTYTNPLSAQVGVNTTSPVNQFDVVGDTAAPAKSGSTRNGILRLATSSAAAVVDFGIAKDNYAWIQSRNSGNYSTLYPLLLNPNGGNVGVNTASPSEKLTVQGNVHVIGKVIPAAAGQLLNVVLLNEGHLSMSNTATINSTTETTLVSYTYTPVSSNSKIYVEFDGNTYINGHGNDEFDTYLNIGGSRVQANFVRFDGGGSGGGGGRGNAPFPISGYFTNSNTSNLTISITGKRSSSDDNLELSPDVTLIIKEVSR